MLFPGILENSLFDGFFGFPFDDGNTQRHRERRELPADFCRGTQALMRTDVRETEKAYEIKIDLPGFAKEEVQVALENGYLTVSAEKKTENSEEKEGRYLRKERIESTGRRTFYVGGTVDENDIRAGFDAGVLTLGITKKETKPEEERKYITVEG